MNTCLHTPGALTWLTQKLNIFAHKEHGLPSDVYHNLTRQNVGFNPVHCGYANVWAVPPVKFVTTAGKCPSLATPGGGSQPEVGIVVCIQHMCIDPFLPKALACLLVPTGPTHMPAKQKSLDIRRN